MRGMGRSVRRAVVMAMLGSFAVPIEAHAQPPAIFGAEARAYGDLLTIYRSGAIERAVEVLDKLLAASDGQRQVLRWIGEAQRENRRTDLEAALLLYSDAIMIAWRYDDPYPTRLLKRYMSPIQRLHLTLKRMDQRSPFLRAWYLLWESFRQVNIHQLIPVELDYLDEALAAFPNDTQILLAAGSREELSWLMSFENAQRDPAGEPPSIRRSLFNARDYLRRSVAADPKGYEARLRLVRVLLELNELADASRLLAEHDWAPAGATAEYLARLFEGDLHERREDRAAAAAAYDRAIALVAVPQSARVARAHLAHLDGRRLEAAQTVTPALSNRSDQSDPWWTYIRGQAWRFDAYLQMARSMVIK